MNFHIGDLVLHGNGKNRGIYVIKDIIEYKGKSQTTKKAKLVHVYGPKNIQLYNKKSKDSKYKYYSLSNLKLVPEEFIESKIQELNSLVDAYSAYQKLALNRIG